MAELQDARGAGASARGEGASGHPTQPLTTWTNMAGAVVSLALIAGVGIWGYKLVVRDVSGLPIVRAAATEMRVRPEDPGGQLAQHQGLAVNEIAAEGAASGPVDKVVLAPPGVALADEDLPVIRADAPLVLPEPLAPAADAFDDTAPTAEAPALEPENPIDAVIAELMRETPPQVENDAGATGIRPQPAVLIGAGASDAGLSGPRASIRPRLRPARDTALLRPAAYTPPEASREIDPAAIPSGTRLAQLGAFESAEIARAEWGRMQQRFGDILEGKSRVIQEAQSGGRTFYRLRAMGFVDMNDTRRFCSAVKAEGVDCIPVQAK